MGLTTGFFDIATEMFRGFNMKRGIGNLSYGVYESNVPKEHKDVDPQNLSTIFMCARILSGTISMMPINVNKDGRPYDEHDLQYNLRHRMSDMVNNQVFWSTIEYQRNIYGNSFVDTRNGTYSIIPIEVVTDWDYKGSGNTLRYNLDWSKDTEGNTRRNTPRKAEWVSAKKILHFKGISADGVMGLPPVSAAMHNMKIMDQATSTITSFYENRAMSPMALESKIDSASGAKATLEGFKTFNDKYTGTTKAGSTMQLPPNTKLTPLQIHFADAELIATMKFTKDEICTMYGIPSFMYNPSESIQMDIEQQSLNFRQFTISPITAIYTEEIKFKKLTKDEVMKNISIKFDTSVLIETDFATMATSYGKLIQNGIVSPAQAAEKFGYEIDNSVDALNFRYVQQQLIPLEMFEMHPAYQSMQSSGNKVDVKEQSKNGDNKNKEDKDKE